MTSFSDYYLSEEVDTIDGIECPSILCDFDANCPSVVDRYFTRFYYRKPNAEENEDHQILFHSNRICLIGLAPSHVARHKGIKSVDFNIGNVDRRENFCTGKGKKGAMNLQPSSGLAIITCNDDSQYKIVSCVTGKLIEVNERLIADPTMAAQEGDGYVAICLPKIDNADVIKEALVSEESYKKLLKHESTNWSLDFAYLVHLSNKIIKKKKQVTKSSSILNQVINKRILKRVWPELSPSTFKIWFSHCEKSCSFS